MPYGWRNLVLEGQTSSKQDQAAKTAIKGGDLVNWDMLPFDEVRLRTYLVSLYKDQVQVVAGWRNSRS